LRYEALLCGHSVGIGRPSRAFPPSEPCLQLSPRTARAARITSPPWLLERPLRFPPLQKSRRWGFQYCVDLDNSHGHLGTQRWASWLHCMGVLLHSSQCPGWPASPSATRLLHLLSQRGFGRVGSA